MHCDRCNVDFTEGLRYCKWCGGPLVDRPRITSELHSCPSCSAAIQPGWAFCKACGERLHTGASESASGAHVAQDSPDTSLADTSLIGTCSSCGERLDTGSLYCKACGKAAYVEQTPFGGSALLCGVCKSYSPIGSRACRVCNAPFGQAARSVVDSPAAATTVQQKVPTLPDLDQQMSAQETPPSADQESEVESGANTLIFSGTGQEQEKQTDPSPPKGTGKTNTLPGTAGSRSEHQAPTQVMQMGRTTGPVEAEEAGGASKKSGDLAGSPATSSGGVEPPANRGQRAMTSEPTVEFAAGSQPAQPAGPTTAGFGSESSSVPAGSESKTEVFVSRAQESPPASRESVSQEEMGTRKFVPVQPSPEPEPTREFQRPAETVIAEQIAPPGSAPLWTAAEPSAPAATPEISHLDPETPPVAQVASPSLPKKRTGTVIAYVVVAVLLIGAAGYVGWLLFGRGKPAPPPTPVAVEPPATTEPPVAPPAPAAPVVPEGMLTVPAGAYTIGRDGADPLVQPEHKVEIPAFFIDRAEVTNGAYKKFLDATGHKPPSNWIGPIFPEGRGNFPVTGVTWQDAADYAVWAGKRLPTEVEWEATARGSDGRIYPWGKDFRSGLANIGSKPDDISADQYPSGIRPVGGYPQGASPAGAVDMIGNAWEWVADEIAPYSGNTETKLKLTPGISHRVIRGGAYDGNKSHDATYRGFLDASQAYPKVGFRCAKDAK